MKPKQIPKLLTLFAAVLLLGCAGGMPAPDPGVETADQATDSVPQLIPWAPVGRPVQIFIFGMLPGLYHGFQVDDSLVAFVDPFLWGENTGGLPSSFPRGVRHGLTMDVMTGAAVPDSLVSFLIRKTDGNPFASASAPGQPDLIFLSNFAQAAAAFGLLDLRHGTLDREDRAADLGALLSGELAVSGTSWPDSIVDTWPTWATAHEARGRRAMLGYAPAVADSLPDVLVSAGALIGGRFIVYFYQHEGGSR